MLELRNVNTFYGNIQALRDVNLRIGDGEIVTLIGANGAGKSTTLMTICGGTPPRSGEVFFKGQPIHAMKPNKIVALGISQVPEGTPLPVRGKAGRSSSAPGHPDRQSER